jgi:hypothetical protein
MRKADGHLQLPKTVFNSSFTIPDVLAMFGVPITFLFPERGIAETSKETLASGWIPMKRLVDPENASSRHTLSETSMP